jgi:RimJ/RimL family protein N-acetyltransferase
MSAKLSQQTDAENSPARIISLVSPRDSHVSIGPVLPDDMDMLFVWLNDAEAARSDFSYRPVDWFAYKDWLDRQVQASSQVLFTVRLLESGRLIGFVVFKNLQPAYRAAELGVRIGREEDRGKGYGTRATRLALDYAWNTLNLRRVSLSVFAGNDRAVAAWHSAGFCQEGVMRDAAYTEGSWRDVVIMAAINPRG